MKVKIFTMVKNEEDIIDFWINYHGSLFGYRNLYIVDNYSNDGTYEKIIKYKKIGINIFQEKDYREKGVLLTKIMKEEKKKDDYDLAIPIDIDEFIVHFDKTNNILNPCHTRQYIDDWLIKEYESNIIFKCNYVQSTIDTDDGIVYKNALLESKYGIYDDYGKLAKSFFNINKWDGVLDHGNHYFSNEYYLTDLVLVHYHCRNIDQMKKKIITNVEGLGYNKDLNELQGILKDNKNAQGYHHIQHMINILLDKFYITTNIDSRKEFIQLSPLSNYFLKLAV